MTHPITRVIDSLIADQERRHVWLFEAREKLRRERMEQSTRGAGEPNKQPVANHGH